MGLSALATVVSDGCTGQGQSGDEGQREDAEQGSSAGEEDSEGKEEGECEWIDNGMEVGGIRGSVWSTEVVGKIPRRLGTGRFVRHRGRQAGGLMCNW